MIALTRRHSLPIIDAKRAVDRLVKEIETRLGIGGLAGQWKGDTLRLSGAKGSAAEGTTGEVAVAKDAVCVTFTLSPPLRTMQKTIEVGLAQFLKRLLSP